MSEENDAPTPEAETEEAEVKAAATPAEAEETEETEVTEDSPELKALIAVKVAAGMRAADAETVARNQLKWDAEQSKSAKKSKKS